jgi:hypothetical protein
MIHVFGTRWRFTAEGLSLSQWLPTLLGGGGGPRWGGTGHLLGPVPSRECLHRTGVGAGALNVSPRIGHLHITVDDLPWWWADASDNNTVDIAGLPPGQHKVTITLVDANQPQPVGSLGAGSFSMAT